MSKETWQEGEEKRLLEIEHEANIAVLEIFEQFAKGSSVLLQDETDPERRACKAIEMLSLLTCANRADAHKDLAQGLGSYYASVAELRETICSFEQYRAFLTLQTSVLGLLRSVNQARFYSQMHNTLRVNKAKSEVIELGRKIAADLWSSDSSIRTGQMADLVYKELISLGYQDQLPGEVGSVREWIAKDAPGNARKPGRPKKAINTK